MASEPDQALLQKAAKKCEFVQEVIRRVEQAMKRNDDQDRQWLLGILDPADPCFKTLVRLFVEPKYKAFGPLQCVVLRVMQLLLKVRVSMLPPEDRVDANIGVSRVDANVGMRCFEHLCSVELAHCAAGEIFQLASDEGSEPIVACNAMAVLSELGRQSLRPSLAPRLLGLFERLPDRADELVEVALRFHAQGGEQRAALLDAAVERPGRGGSLLCEVLLQVINRADERRRMRSLKVLAGCLARPSSESLLYTNDVRVLVEILLRELPNHADDATAFACHADCFKVLAARCEVARTHRRPETIQVLEDIRLDSSTQAVRAKCDEVLTAFAIAGA